MPLPIRVVSLRRGDRRRLERLARSRTTPHRVVERTQSVLASAAGQPGSAICQQLGVSRPTVTCWLDRSTTEGVAGLLADRPRSGRPRRITAADEAAMVERTLHTKPPGEQSTPWSTRLMAQATGYHHATIARLWRAHGLQPHRGDWFKRSKDPAFVAQLRDVVGLYLHPPERAVVFAFDEKSPIQALARTQPGLPLKRGRAGTLPHDYQRHGTTTLFAALEVATGRVLQDCMAQHRHQEFLRFMRHVERSVPAERALHVILDNSATHKPPRVRRWLARHPRGHLHFTPTSASWLNLVERCFSELTERQLRRLAVTSVDELIATITRYVDHRNEHPTPFAWTATVRQILAKVNKANETLATLH